MTERRSQALVLGYYWEGETNKRLRLLTREFGYVTAKVQALGAHSKLRSSLTTFALVDALLVYGKSGWRLITAEPLRHFYYEATTLRARQTIARICSLAERLVRGEMTEPALFDQLLGGLAAIVAAESRDEERGLELRVVYELLLKLGYVSESSRARSGGVLFSPAEEKQIFQAINQALEQADL